MNRKLVMCSTYKNELSITQFKLSKTDLNGLKGLTNIKLLNQHIKDLLNLLKKLNCEETSYLKPEPKPKKSMSTKLKLNREKNTKKLFINSPKRKFIKEQLPPKKRFSFIYDI